MNNETKPGAVDSILAIWHEWARSDGDHAKDAMMKMRPHMEILAAATAEPVQQDTKGAESFLEVPDVQDESGLNMYYSRELVLECIEAALAANQKEGKA